MSDKSSYVPDLIIVAFSCPLGERLVLDLA